MTHEETARLLYARAIQADARYGETINSRTQGKRTRWTLTEADKVQPEIVEAYREKVNADQTWAMFQRGGKMKVWIVFEEWAEGGDGGHACIHSVHCEEGAARAELKRDEDQLIAEKQQVWGRSAEDHGVAEDDFEERDWDVDVHVEEWEVQA